LNKFDLKNENNETMDAADPSGNADKQLHFKKTTNERRIKEFYQKA
jgi:hypothetical protein